MSPDTGSTAGGNTLWLTFLAAWIEEAQVKGSKVARTYRKAHQSLAACPIEFQHPCQTTQLAGIGPTIANKLEQELQRWCEENGRTMPGRPSREASTSKSSTRVVVEDDDSTEAAQDGSAAAKRSKAGASDRPTKKRAYVPQHRSGAYGLLVGLYISTRVNSSTREDRISKTQLINAARPYSDTEYEAGASSSRSASAAVPLSSQYGSSGGAGGHRSFYTGWTSIKTLIAKGYVVQSGNPARYCLGDEGAIVAETLARDAGVEESASQIIGNPTENDDDAQLSDDWSDDEQGNTLRARISNFEPELLKAGSYTIHLVVDNRERYRPGGRKEKEQIATLLLERGVDTETRALEVGDAVWIARRKNGTGQEADEVVLDHIVERKRLDDLVSSILDGRWRDQKFRLSSSGLSKVLYLIEDYDVENQMRRFGPQIKTALSSSQVVDGFFVERTCSLAASIDYLASMDDMIRKIYEDQDLSVMPSAIISRSSFLETRDALQHKSASAFVLTSFEAFQALNSKSGGLTSTEVFGKMLLCIKGMSAEKVREVLAIYNTVRELSDAYQELTEDAKDAEGMLAGCTEGMDQRKKIGPALSKKVAEVFLQARYAAD
ncbi:related to MUS81 - endonuclease involved in DNA repair and replication fork stability [Melanopsichium pennsylvanicum]|uniref:Crossover junction endonuclease MUS81 n=1 Tax=Melanopsichium pennsylvanicum TaxID=63383 RepID=A0AAJ4XQM5_9BASI|nr:related to MUS81 - endonuclease involved in DNA repair and replication fork stability [Melanopsichium pennsylvanicum]